MLNIIRNCSHNSFVQTGFDLDGEGNPSAIVRKTFLLEGVGALQREYESIEWYCQRLGIEAKEELLQFHHSERYGVLRLRYHLGLAGDYFCSIVDNYDRIHNLIVYYCGIFRDDPSSRRSHGDLSLGNVIFGGNEVHRVIDWENCNEVMPLAYDLIYCITENCLLRLLRKHRLSAQDVRVYWKSFYQINQRIPLEPSAQESPVHWCQRVAKEYAIRSGVNHQKCPLLAFEPRPLHHLGVLLDNGRLVQGATD